MSLFSHLFLKFFVCASLLSLAHSAINWKWTYRVNWENTGIEDSSSGTLYLPKIDECTNEGVKTIGNDEKVWGTIVIGEPISIDGTQSEVYRADLTVEEGPANAKKTIHGALKYVDDDMESSHVVEGAQLAKFISRRQRATGKEPPFPYLVEPFIWFWDTVDREFAFYELMTGTLKKEWDQKLVEHHQITKINGHTIAEWQYAQALMGLTVVHAGRYALSDISLDQWLVVEDGSAFPTVKLSDLDDAEEERMVSSSDHNDWDSPEAKNIRYGGEKFSLQKNEVWFMGMMGLYALAPGATKNSLFDLSEILRDKIVGLTPRRAQKILEDAGVNLGEAMTNFFSHMLCREADRWNLQTVYKNYWVAISGSKDFRT